MSEIAYPDVSVIHPKPGDTVVVSYAVDLSHHQVDEIYDHAKAHFPGCQIVVTGLGGRIEIEPKDGD